MLTMTIRSKRFNCDITLENRVTILWSDSGKGKSEFVRSLYKDRRKSVELTVSDAEYTPVTLRDQGGIECYILRRYIEDGRKSIFVFDDDVRFINSEEFAQICRNDTTNYYVMISRLEPLRFSKGLYSGELSGVVQPFFGEYPVYEFVADGKEHHIIPLRVARP